MAKRRRVRFDRLFLLIFLIFIVVSGTIYLILTIDFSDDTKTFNIDELNINDVDYSNSKLLPIDINSKGYLLIRLNDFKVLYANDIDKMIYPASLTKVLALDALLEVCDNLYDVSSYTDSQREYLIEQNASLAGLKTNSNYTIKELLYALILPSGADAAMCLSNYAESKGYNLVDLMNNKCNELGLNNSHFTNTTGLHDENLYTSLNDYSKIVIDVLLKNDGKDVLKTISTFVDGKLFHSTLESLSKRDDNAIVYGGKTGFTYEAGLNIMSLFEVNNRSYLLILASADSDYGNNLHIEDANKIIELLVND